MNEQKTANVKVDLEKIKIGSPRPYSGKPMMGTLDKMVLAAQKLTSIQYLGADGKILKECDEYIDDLGIRSRVSKLCSEIQRLPVDLTKVLLGTPGVFETLLLKALKTSEIDPSDTKEILFAIQAEAGNDPRKAFITHLVNEYADAKKLKLDAVERTRLLNDLAEMNIPVLDGTTDAFLVKATARIMREGNLPMCVELFANRGEIDRARFTDTVKASMVRYLERLGVQGMTAEKVKNKEFDEYFVQAYHQAVFGSGNLSDLSESKSDPSEYDFDVETFEFAEEQGVVRDNILAASSLYYHYILGDVLGIFHMPNILLVKRAKGHLDIDRSVSFKLQSYKRLLKNASLEPEERQLLVKRVFNLGDGEVLPDTVLNEEFQMLWHSLMREVTSYIQKSEANSSEIETKISRSPIDEAVRNLQYNLSFYARDIADDVMDLQDQFSMAQAILKDEQIIASAGVGQRKNMWSLIESLTSQELNRAPKARSLRTIAVEGYKIIQYIARFDVTSTDEDFRSLLKSAEAWILAQANVGEDLQETSNPNQTDEEGDVNNEDDWEN